jgi:hypothetical protein
MFVLKLCACAADGIGYCTPHGGWEVDRGILLDGLPRVLHSHEIELGRLNQANHRSRTLVDKDSVKSS